MRLFLIFLLILTTGYAFADESRVRQLDILVSSKLDQKLLMELVPERFKQQPLSQQIIESDIAWLKTKAAEGQVLLTYVLAYRLSVLEPSEAVQWYAKARIWAFLDAAECVYPTRTPWSNILEGLFPQLNVLRKEHSLEYLKAVEDALLNDSSYLHPSPSWYCTIGLNENILLPEQAIKARQERIGVMFEANKKKLISGKDE